MPSYRLASRDGNKNIDQVSQCLRVCAQPNLFSIERERERERESDRERERERERYIYIRLYMYIE